MREKLDRQREKKKTPETAYRWKIRLSPGKKDIIDGGVQFLLEIKIIQKWKNGKIFIHSTLENLYLSK